MIEKGVRLKESSPEEAGVGGGSTPSLATILQSLEGIPSTNTSVRWPGCCRLGGRRLYGIPAGNDFVINQLWECVLSERSLSRAAL